jgi:hypothetical protein
MIPVRENSEIVMKFTQIHDIFIDSPTKLQGFSPHVTAHLSPQAQREARQAQTSLLRGTVQEVF